MFPFLDDARREIIRPDRDGGKASMHVTATSNAPLPLGMANHFHADSPSGSPPPPRLLIVEDDPMTGNVLSRLFRRMGWEVLVSMTVEDGLASLKTRPDCAILDLNLPDGDGVTVLAAIREAGLATRVVVATGTGDRDHFERVRRLGPEGLLRKPVFLEQILEAFGIQR